jgi:hypothetical protein
MRGAESFRFPGLIQLRAGFLANSLKKVDNSSPTLSIFWSARLLIRRLN